MQETTDARLDQLFGANRLRDLSQTPEGEAGLRALTRVAAAATDLPDDPATRRLALLTRTGWPLLIEHRQAAPVITLTRIPAPDLADHPQLAHLRLTCLIRSGRLAELHDELIRLVAVARTNEALRSALRSTVLSNGDACAPLFRFLDDELFGGADGHLPERMRRLRSDAQPQMVEQSIVRNVAAVRATPEAGFQQLRDDINWGRFMAGYFKFVMAGYNHHVLTLGPDAPETVEIRARTQAIRSAVRVENTLLQQAARRGQSIVIAGLHTGMSAITDLGTKTGNLPLSIVAVGAAANAPAPNFHVPADAPDVTIRFLKLCKMMKAGQRLVHIFPDGPLGELQEGQLFGRTIQIGRGAAVLAWRGRAATFVPRSQWDGHTATLFLDPGPNAAVYDDPDQFADDFAEFYLAQIRAVILGPPIDMAPNGGFWRFFQ